MIDFLLNLGTSAYFALGAVSIMIVIWVLIITPLMNQITSLNNVVMEKLSLLPTTQVYGQLFEVITDQNVNNDALLKEYEIIKQTVSKLTDAVNDINHFQSECDDKMQQFVDSLAHLTILIKEYTTYFEFNDDRTSTQINSLVRARIDTTTFLIELMETLQQSKAIPAEFKSSSLYEIREDLRIGFESIKNKNYKSNPFNPRSGSIDKLTDFKY